MPRRRSKQTLRKVKRSRLVQLEKLEPRHLLAATPLGATPLDTGEFLLGSVAVTPVFFESDGSINPQSQNWTPEEIDEALAKVTEGVTWWSDLLDRQGTVHTLDFVIDDSFAIDPVETGYEPIDLRSDQFNLYVGAFVTSLGYGDSASIEEGVRRFNHDQRLKLGTDWAFTIFLVDSSDGDGLFSSGGTFSGAFAYAGGLFLVAHQVDPLPRSHMKWVTSFGLAMNTQAAAPGRNVGATTTPRIGMLLTIPPPDLSKKPASCAPEHP